MDSKATPEDREESFRGILEDVAGLARKLAPHCSSLEDLVGMCELALSNHGQLRLLMATVEGGDSRGGPRQR